MDAVEEIKGRLAIEDVISEYVQLKRAGRNFKGLSPFTNERTPSFVVSPEKQIWHDFSSGKGGDMFTFVEAMEGLDFRGALELLARKAGIELEQYKKGRDDTKQKERLYHLLEQTAKFYQANLKANKDALSYVLQKRQFTKETVLQWRLGYSPNTGAAVVDFAKKQGFNQREIQQAGLTNRFGGDMFRGRLMVPLQDQQGRVVGFTARLLAVDDPQAPKYINTPQTALYDKSRHVFGLHLAKESIRKTKFVVLAEGNLDVIASHQAGIMQCVATAGTALTEQQLKTLKRFTGDVRLSFDADAAGIAATERAIPIASKVSVRLSVITIPNGKDPDELIRQDQAAWGRIVNEPKYVLDWLIDYYQKQLDLTKPGNKLVFSDTVLTVVRTLSDRVEQEHYVQRVADIIDVSREALLQMKLDHTEKPTPLKPHRDVRLSKIEQENLEVIKKQNKLIALLLLQPHLRDLLVSLRAEFLPEENAKFVFNFLKEQPDFDGTPSKAAGLKEVADYVKMLSLQYEELYQGVELLELRNDAEYLQSELVKQYVKTQKANIKEAYKNATAEEQRALLEKDKELNALRNTYKGGN